LFSIFGNADLRLVWVRNGGEIKKGKYVYYHCSGARGKCGEPYVRQETLEEAYAAMLRRISIDEEIVNWIATGTRSGSETNR
jgi:hypothetical protein